MKLASVIRKWRLMSERDLRSLAKEIGVSVATLSRFERGHDCDGKTLSKILTWLLAKESTTNGDR